MLARTRSRRTDRAATDLLELSSMSDDDGTPVRLRDALDAVPAYVPGRPLATPTGMRAYKLSSNENPYPPLPSVLKVIRDAAGSVNRYPDMAVTALTDRLAEALAVDPSCIATGTGSVGVLGQVIQAACDPEDEVVFAWRSFEAYPIVTALAGARAVMVPVDEQGRHRLGAMADAVTDRTKVVLVCSPNNPTGPAVGQGELDAFLARVPERVLVVVDEAYLEFVTSPDRLDALALWHKYPNVVVLRTFSKAYGLAGLRVGYAVAHPVVATALRKTAVPFGVNTIAQAAAVASLDAEDELVVRVKDIVAERDRVAAALRAQGWQIPTADGNFVWLPVGERSADLVAAFEAAGLAVRAYGTDGVRVTIGEHKANDLLIEVAGRWHAAG